MTSSSSSESPLIISAAAFSPTTHTIPHHATPGIIVFSIITRFSLTLHPPYNGPAASNR